MTTPLAPIPASRKSLLKPLDDRDILVQNEQAYYAERQHWASVARPIYETFVFLLFVVWAVDRIGGASFGYDWVGLLLLIATVHAAVALAFGVNPTSRLAVDPFSSAQHKKPGRATLVPGVLILTFAVVFGVIRLVAMVAVVVVICRLVVILARWSFYERRYITNRRVIESGGFLGSRISTMPLSQMTDISYTRTIPGELFGYATMRVETAGQDQALGTVKYIADPDHFYEVLISFSAPAERGGE